MRDTVTTSCRRLSDHVPAVQAQEVRQLETWENEGGQSTPSAATSPDRRTPSALIDHSAPFALC